MIGIIIGHDILNQGMTIYNGMTEYQFNQKIADIIFNKFNKNIKIFTRIPTTFHESCRDVAKRVAACNIDTTIELHLNALNNRTKILGCETVTLSNPKSVSRAHGVRFFLGERFGIKDRGNICLERSGRGYFNLKSLAAEGVSTSMILEPCFADTENVDSIKIIGNPEAYASFLVETLEKFNGL